MSSKRPMILVFAGPNGSGKSTITPYFDKVGTYTNADVLVETTGMNNRDAAIRVDESRYHSIENREDFTVDPLINVGRVKERVSFGGHDVDRDKIIERYHKSLHHIKELIE